MTLRYPNLEVRSSLNCFCSACREPIHLIGVEFSRESRSVVGFEVERDC